jgi:hypothetical protein
MTEEELDNLTEDQQWDVFGCASRCLLYLANFRGIKITKEEFINRFRHKFTPKRIGLTNTAEVIDMARELGLCRSANSFRCREKVRDMCSKRMVQGVLLYTDLNESGAQNFHCRLIIDGDDQTVELFSPFQGGTEPILHEKWDSLEAQLCHFLVLV